MIPILELKTQYAEIQQELEEAVLEALRGTHYILGSQVSAFEQEFAHYHGQDDAVGVGSGTEALHLALRALELKPGDEVLCPTFTFIATAGAVGLAGGTPVFVDVDPCLYALDPKLLEEKINPRTRAIVVVHLFGHPAPMGPIMEIANRHNLVVIEDCAQATGAAYEGKKVGTLGHFGCFSFFPSKNLGGLGDGGMVLADTPERLDAVRMLRGHGSRVKYYHEVLGTNSRLDTLQAAGLRVKLRHLDRWNERRRAVAARYTEHLKEVVSVPGEAPDSYHVYHQYTIRVPERDQVKAELAEKGVGSMIYYPVSLHLQEAFRDLGQTEGSYPVSEKAQKEVLSLPMFPELDEARQDQVIEAVQAVTATRVAKAG